ncbi:restriction endonuclease [Kitasatospora sp. RB6PN24]|uniref:restriction endonuclease n=1 Tax=Kitasatospora humi TaxID=2893891 RepID=UPI001E6324D3|nr:restriction endonuclease [Kitasatospora humi]MCC9307471.1 restriction endonuclease [Kitasatospora humi]
MLAEAQRQRQRQYEAQQRAARAAQLQYERDQRAAQRAAAQQDRAALRAYQEAREADAAARTGRLEQRVAELQAVLRTGLAGRPLQLAALRRPAQLPPFDPGELARPIPVPDPAGYRVPPLVGMQALNPTARRHHDAQAADANARYQHDWQAAQAAEQQRLRQLARYRAEFDAWAAEEQRQAAQRAEWATAVAAGLQAGSPSAVAEFFEAALRWRTDWPDDFPNDGTVAWDGAAQQLVIDWQLPGFDVVPAAARVRYVKAGDRETEVARTATERRSIHRSVLAQCALRLIAEVFRADRQESVASVVFNGYVESLSPATGLRERRTMVSVTADRSRFLEVDLARVDAISCLKEALDGRLAGRPDKWEAVRAFRTAEEVGSARAGDEDPDLHEMDPIEFEHLIAELFRARGLRAQTTTRSGDEGVDVLAEDPDPVTGGRIVIQVKRYRHTVPPAAVRDLDATMRRNGANRGILVTTSGFGPGSHRWAEDKPLTLIDGPMLLGLLKEHGLRGRLGGGPSPRSAALTLALGANAVLPGGPLRLVFDSVAAPADLSVLLLGAAGKVRGDQDFVFYHQPNTPDGTVVLGPTEQVGGRIRQSATVLLSELPADVRCIAVAVAMDVDSTATLAALSDGSLTVTASDGSVWSFSLPADPGLSAVVVIEFYRRHAGTAQEQWKIRSVGQGWSDGLAGLARTHGVDVS